jgi:hypothetical protein
VRGESGEYREGENYQAIMGGLHVGWWD